MTRLPREGIRSLSPYLPGLTIEEIRERYSLERVIKLASNENPIGPSPRVLERIQEELSELHRYPEGSGKKLKEAIARKWNLSPEWIVLGNGSNEILELIVRTFVEPGDTVVSADITFAVYPLISISAGARYISVPLKNFTYDLKAIGDVVRKERARLVFLANPNNPTGTAFFTSELENFLSSLWEDTLVVYDSAYAEYALPFGVPDGLSFLSRYPNLFVVRTFSKVYGLAGLRIGWCAGNPEWVTFVEKVRQPFNVNRLAIAGALAALEDDSHAERVVQLNSYGLKFLTEEISRMGFQVVSPSYANFVLFETPFPADTVMEEMMKEGVIIRSMRSFGLKNHLRVNTGTVEEMEIFLETFKKVISRLSSSL
jgi:histidinol-phosphate aminotransferase